MSESLKAKTLKALAWNAVQRYGTLFVNFFANLYIARQLTPDDYGVVGIMMVFVAVAATISDSGFPSALVQKKDTTQTDYCTAFFWNIAIGLLLYAAIFLAAPLVADYFDNPLFIPVLRLQGVIIIVNAFGSVQISRLSKTLQFKVLAIRSLIAAIVGTAIGVGLVACGYGIWGLVWQAIVTSGVSVVLLWSIARWRPQMLFSWSAFRQMFGFGSYIFVSNICNTLYTNVQSFIIGKAFSVRDLGYYSQAQKLEQVPAEGTSSVLAQVLFPVYASIADDRGRHIDAVRKNMKVISFVTFPLMMLLIIVAFPLIRLMLTDKWIQSIPMFQILCIVGMFTPVNVANTEIFRSIGAGKIYFILQTLKRVVGLVFIFASVPFGLYPFLWAIATMSIVTYAMNLYCTSRYFGYKCSDQLRDILPNLLLTLSVGGITALAMQLFDGWPDIVQVLVATTLYGALFLLTAVALRMKTIGIVRSLLSRHN